MRTRAQGLLSDGEEQGIAGSGNHKSPQGLIKKIKLKISNGRYGRGSETLKEPPAAKRGEALKIVLKRKAAQEPQEALVIKKHKRGVHRRQELVHEEEDEEEKSEPLRAAAAKIKVKGSGRASEDASISVAAEEVRGGVPEEQEAGGDDAEEPLPVVTTTEVASESAGQFCTVNMEMVAERSEVSLSSEPSCSADSKSSRKRQAEDDPAAVNGQLVLLKASRTPLFVPAKRSPLPLPPPAAAATSPVVAAQVAATPAVRSALPAPPAVRSALPVPCETASGGEDKVVMEEVDIHGFSSAVTGPGVLPPVQDQSSEEDGFSLPEDEMLSSSMFFGNPWHDEGSLQERKRGGPGSRATYRCSRCLAPKKGHRCPLEESPGEDAKTDAVPKLAQKRPPITTSNELLLLQNGEKSQSPETTTNQDDGPVSAEDTSKVETAKAGKTKATTDPVVKEFTVSSKWLLESGVLEGHAVRYMPRPGEVLGTGFVKNGVILCNCRHCKGHQGFNASSFEKHVGSTARHPSDFIFLENGRRLRDILEDGSRFRDKPNMMGALRTAVSVDWDASC